MNKLLKDEDELRRQLDEETGTTPVVYDYVQPPPDVVDSMEAVVEPDPAPPDLVDASPEPAPEPIEASKPNALDALANNSRRISQMLHASFTGQPIPQEAFRNRDPEAEALSKAKTYAEIQKLRAGKASDPAGDLRRRMYEAQLKKLQMEMEPKPPSEKDQAYVEYLRAKAEALKNGKPEDPLDAEVKRARIDYLRNAQPSRERAQEAKENKEKDKLSREDRKFYLGGFELKTDEAGTPVALPTEPEVRDLRKMQGTNKTINETVQEILDLHKKHGSQVLPTAARARMRSLAGDLQLVGKDEENYKLGVLAGPDKAILDALIPDPTSKESTILDFVGSPSTVVALQTMADQANRKFRNKVGTLYQPEGTAAKLKGGAGASADGKITIFNEKTGEKMRIRPEKLKEAEADGFKQVAK